jgi:phosphohistidine swiveling domain-containing protein
VERGTRAIVESSVGQQREGLFVESGVRAAEWRKLGESGAVRKLTDQQVQEYAGMLERIADHYGRPMDTEWALADGAFQVLQARPITTLAEEYDQELVDTSQPWQFLVRRPMPVVETSIWAHWLDSEHAGKDLPMETDHVLSIQDETGLANHFMSRHAGASSAERIRDMLQNDRGRIVELLQQGQAIYTESLPRIEAGAEAFATVQEATDFFVHAAQYTTVLPAMVLNVYEQDKMDDPEIRELAEGIRSRTLYPSIQRNIIDPMLLEAARGVHFSAPEEARDVVLWGEVCENTLDRDVLEARLADVRAGRHFIFQSDGQRDQLRFVSQTGYLLTRLARHRHVDFVDDPDRLQGQAAWPGIYQGRARVVLSPDAVGVEFHVGEVLISIQSSPALMPLLRRCGAVVTDDGGIACHAAIIARELRKPTLIGTRQATSTIKTGDLVEVDTYEGVVKILERAG